jgi:acyl-CoA dehydrogenase family protein 9
MKGFGVVSEYTRRRVSLATGYSRQGTTFTKLDPSLKAVATIFEDATRDLATASDRILRKHGRAIIDKQFATRRLADMMIDLFVLASVISRVDSSTRRVGTDKAKKELEIATVFARQAQRRIETNLDEIDNNVDESIKSLADQAFEVEKFSWDTL